MVNVISPAGVGVVSRSTAAAWARKAMREHGQGGPAVSGFPAPDLVLIEPDQPFGGLEGFLDAPTLAGQLHEGCVAGPGGGV